MQSSQNFNKHIEDLTYDKETFINVPFQLWCAPEKRWTSTAEISQFVRNLGVAGTDKYYFPVQIRSAQQDTFGRPKEIDPAVLPPMFAQRVADALNAGKETIHSYLIIHPNSSGLNLSDIAFSTFST